MSTNIRARQRFQQYILTHLMLTAPFQVGSITALVYTEGNRGQRR